MIRLGVNIDHVATLRNARGTPYPDIAEAAAAAEAAGADGITAHLREDRRHMRDDDMRLLKRVVKTRLNMEMAVAPDVLAVALEIAPHEVCLVPERRMELTTEGGLDAAANAAKIAPAVESLRARGVDVSLFIDPDIAQVRAAKALGAPTVEFHTGAYANASGEAAAAELERLFTAAREAVALGLRVNAGHGLSYENVRPVLSMPGLDTLNIGHSIVARSVFCGLAEAVREMRSAMAR